MKYIVANWKSHKTLEEAVSWMERLTKEYTPRSDEVVVVAACFAFLNTLAEKIKEMESGQISLAAQDISPFPFGAYTGAVAAAQIREMVEVVIVGHSERREYFHETHHEIANKITQILEVGLRPLLCVDEPYAREQLAAVRDEDMHNLVVAYEPLGAIGSGVPQDSEEVKRTVAKLLEIVPKVPILYGGSVTPENANTYMNIEGVSGLLVGGASLDVEKFIQLLKAC